jgi:hypothetical protein
MEKITSLAIVTTLALGVFFSAMASVGLATAANQTGASMANQTANQTAGGAANQTANQTAGGAANQTNQTNPLAKIPVIGQLFGGGKK